MAEGKNNRPKDREKLGPCLYFRDGISFLARKCKNDYIKRKKKQPVVTMLIYDNWRVSVEKGKSTVMSAQGRELFSYSYTGPRTELEYLYSLNDLKIIITHDGSLCKMK